MTSSTESGIQNLNLPKLASERCVHTHITNASCEACVDVCHADAWQLESRQLELDTTLCDGCGICASVCPETAIEHAHNPLSIQWRNEQLALVACEKIPERLSDQSDGIINCVHALSLRDLLNLYAAGHHRLLVSTAPCQDCDRGATEVLNRQLITLNSLLKQRGQSPFERINITGEQWLNIIRSADHANAKTSLSRRQFLRTTANEISDYGLRHFDLKSDEQTAPAPVAKLLPAKSGEQVLPYVPEIDIRLCSACDTCIKLCPHDALQLDKQNGEAVYQIDAENCTGCAICIDVCEDEAIQIKLNSIVSQQLITLNDCACQACGVRFHTLDAKGSALCPICQKKKHHTALFQVID